MSSAISVKPMRRSRKAATAISLAALSTTGADAARLERGARQPQARKLVQVGLEEGERAHARQVEPGGRQSAAAPDT